MKQLNVALQLAAAGRRIFPADPETKRPMIAGWQNLATTNPETIVAWWSERPEAMPSIALEATELVIDIDPRNGGGETLDRLMAEHPELVPLFKTAPTVRTPSGGAHFYFSVPADRPVLNGKWLDGIDVKTKGGFVVAPGATRADGKAYELLHDGDPPPAFECVLAERARTTQGDHASTRQAPVVWAVGEALEGPMAPGLVALLAPRLAARGQRHEVARAIGGALAATGWSDEGIASVVGGLPSDDPAARVRDALGAAARARAGEPTPQWGALERAGYAPALVAAIRTMAGGGALEALEAETAANRATAAATDTTSDPGFGFGERRSVANVYAPLPVRNWVCEGLLYAPGPPTLLSAYGGTGKTWTTQALGVCIATGKPAFGRFALRAGRFLHLDYEQGADETFARYQRLAAALGLEAAELVGKLDVITFPQMNLMTPNAYDALARLCDGYVACAIDSLRAACPGIDENDSRVREPLDMAARVSEATGCAFLFSHHERKTKKDEAGGQNQAMRGSSAINDAAQTVISLQPMRGGVKASCSKARIGKAFKPFGLGFDDVHVERAPFAGMKISIVDAAARDTAEAQDELAADCAAVLEFMRGQPGGIVSGNEAVFVAALKGKVPRDRVRQALATLESRRSIFRDQQGREVRRGVSGTGSVR